MNKRRIPLILGLDEYGLTWRELCRLGGTDVHVEVGIQNSPDVWPGRARFHRLLARSPGERRAAVRQWRIRHYDKLRTALSDHRVTTLRYNGDPVGVRVWLPAHDLSRALSGHQIERIKILRIEGMNRKRIPTTKTPGFYAVKARFAQQIESETKGMQAYEDRVLLVRARSFAEAGRKAMREFRKYESPHLTVTGHFCRWSFETIIDIYHVLDDKIDPNGTEVYSETRARRMKPGYEWKGK